MSALVAVRLIGKTVRGLPLPSSDEGKQRRGCVLAIGGYVQMPGHRFVRGVHKLQIGWQPAFNRSYFSTPHHHEWVPDAGDRWLMC